MASDETGKEAELPHQQVYTCVIICTQILLAYKSFCLKLYQIIILY